MDLQAISALSKADMSAVNALIYRELNSDVALINQIAVYIVNSGGKRMRPLLAVLASRALGYQGQDHIKMAAIIEFIHTSTLLHDDVVDESEQRRGQDTANERFGNAASVLVGDFLYTRAFQLMTELGSLRIMDILAEATNVIAEGEVQQLMNCNNPDITEADYFSVIYSKTAKLFEAATRLGAVIAKQEAHIEQAFANYGKYLGTAFQIMDDILDYDADSNQTGKNVGDDLAEGKATLPLLYAMRHGTPAQRQMIRQAIEQGDGQGDLTQVLSAMRDTGALDYSRRAAMAEADKAIKALDELADSPHKEALIGLAHIAAARSN
ncbi:octaprenyl diphosphate synthase [Celerinatantimonas yamalensis]|uniref:Octaprenyl diphosphate synthase n=1 Tax=Celerinatantimonas yamalensis TaxID=559956 RepID=A0ABW9GAI2_9GAMM